MTARSGQAPFVFEHIPDLHNLPTPVRDNETALHGGFACDNRPDRGELYYGMPGSGLIRIDADLKQQHLIELPEELAGGNFHSTKIGQFDGETRLFLPANENEMVVVMDLDGTVAFVLPRPEFEAYQDHDVPFRPTDVIPRDGELYVADGYGANHILKADLHARKWVSMFGGRTEDPHEHGRFGTAHGISAAPHRHDHMVVADRPHSRLEISTYHGHHHASHALPDGSRPCGTNFRTIGGRCYAVVASLDDPRKGRPAPIYILDGNTFDVVSTIRPKEELGIEAADHLHNVVWHEDAGQLYLVCQAWNPGHYFVLAAV